MSDTASLRPSTRRSATESIVSTSSSPDAHSYPPSPSSSDAHADGAAPISHRGPFDRPPVRRVPIQASPLRPGAGQQKNPRMRSTMVTGKEPGAELMRLKDRHPARSRLSYFLTYGMILVGAIGGGIQCYFSYTGVTLDRQPLCLVAENYFDDESTVFGDNGLFFREVDMSGFGNGEFEMATDSSNNSYIKDGKLYIVPTLTSDNLGSAAIFNGSVYNITGCTYNTTQGSSSYTTTSSLIDGDDFDYDAYYTACSAVSNISTGAVINPVQSARLSTRGRASIRYGRVEIRAKMPVGDWLWPAIWMLPVDNKYGPWPMSGEIDIVESRGNSPKYTYRGSNYVQGSLNWGPAPGLNGVSKTFSWWTERRKQFNEDFHTYALEWTEDFLRIYVDSRLHTLLDLRFNQPFFDRGDFASVYTNTTTGNIGPLQNPWINGTDSTPFDQEFYLILNVAAGGTNGWFPDYQGDKPWFDESQTAMYSFAKAQDTWYETWPTDVEERAMVIDYVKMWKHC